jgi:anti-sigma factor ChrR (cupin superfamily)
MDCRRWEELLFERIEGDLSSADEASLQAHQRTCRPCRELQALLGGEAAGASAPEVPEALVADVLRRTSGDPCGRAALLLAEALDVAGELAERPQGRPSSILFGGPTHAPGSAHDPALAAHLKGCARCTAMAGALARLGGELPRLVGLDPGAGFVAEVMAATAGADAARRLHPAAVQVAAPAWLARLQATLQRLAARPRFALEGAYAVALVFFLIFGLPSPSLAELPARALDGIRDNAARVRVVAGSGFDVALDYGLGTWDEVADRFDAWLASEGAVAGASHATLRTWAGALRDLAGDIWNNLFAPFAENLRALWRPDGGATDE